MKVLVTLAKVPFAPSPVERLALALVAQLMLAGMAAEPMVLPVGEMTDDETLLDGGVAAQMLGTVNIDRAIALNYPAYRFRVPVQVIWLTDETWLPAARLADGTADHMGADYGGADHMAADDRRGEIAAALCDGDAYAFEHARMLFCGSEILRDRVARWCGARATVLPVPASWTDPEAWQDVLGALLA